MRGRTHVRVKFKEDIVEQVKKDYLARAELRRAAETQWRINANFVSGNQYCFVGADGNVEDEERDYPWQEREVFNHVAPIYETRLAKLNRVRPKMSVRPTSNDEDDVKSAKASGKILDSACRKMNFSDKIGVATGWSELAGSSFYKVVWDPFAGKKIGSSGGNDVYEGDVRVDVCPPYEIFPPSLSCGDVESCDSIIHARAVGVDEIKRVYGEEVEPEEISVVAYSSCAGGAMGYVFGVEKKSDCALVIERYTRPTSDLPNGELAIIAGNKLLFYGELPYINGEDSRRSLPFIKQDSISVSGSFFGVSPIERIVPIQRAYNAVKNRKHEFMNRIAMGVLAVEDGSVDTDSLIEDGLCPGKILVYRQGSVPPRLLDPGRVPSDFGAEEDRLLNEFISVSGVSEIMRNSSLPSSVTSGTAIQLLIEQDDTRLSVTAENIRVAIREVARQILRLYKQFALKKRLSRCVGDEGDTELMFWQASDIGCDDVVFDTENELNSTPAANKSFMFELLNMGLLHDENGKLSDAMRYKILDSLGYGGWEMTRDTTALHISRAEKENLAAAEEKPTVEEIDDHNVHIATHTKYLLCSETEKLAKKNPEIKEILLEHIREHKRFLSLTAQSEGGMKDENERQIR